MNSKKGVIITLIAAVFWGFSGTCGQYIFDNFGADPTYLTAYRLLFAGSILMVLGFIKNGRIMVSVWRDRARRLRLVLFAVCGIMFCQLSYMEAIANSNSGTATTLQYIGPVLVMIVSCIFAKRLPQKKETLAIIFVVIGVFLIATHGNPGSLVLTPAGLSWGLASAVAVMLYTLLPVGLTEKYGSILVTGYGMFLGGIILFTASGAWRAPMIYDLRCILAFGAIIIFGSILPFTMYIAGVNLCGAVKASMLASIEPAAATIFMVVWLGETLTATDLAGFAFILATVFLLAKKEDGALPSQTSSLVAPATESPRPKQS